LDEKYAAFLAWTALVKGGGPWDSKVELNAAGISSVKLAGGWFSSDISANIHYACVGLVSGFSEDWLLTGAGIAQIMGDAGHWSFFMTRFDDPADAAAIKAGMYLWQHYSDQQLTPDLLKEALDLYRQWLRTVYPGPWLPESSADPSWQQTGP
jgi:hypothetical protein